MKKYLLLILTLAALPALSQEIQQTTVADTAFVNLTAYSKDFVYDMKYATADNFLKTKVYDCAECYLRYKTVRALIEANEKFMKKG